MTRRKIITYIATSADGYISRSDGNVDWLNRPSTAGDYGMGDFFKTIDTILWGRKTFAPVEAGKHGGGSSKGIKNYVFTTNPPRESSKKNIEYVNEPIGEFAKRLRRTEGKNIWMMGGAGIIGSFLDAGEIDEFMIHVIPVFIGEGIPLIQPRNLEVQLKLLSTKSYEDGVVRLHYEVERSVKTSKLKSGKRK